MEVHTKREPKAYVQSEEEVAVVVGVVYSWSFLRKSISTSLSINSSLSWSTSRLETPSRNSSFTSLALRESILVVISFFSSVSVSIRP